MLGFLSHLLLDKLYDVDLLGSKIHPKTGAGSPLKLISSSWSATIFTYLLLAGLGYLAYMDLNGQHDVWHSLQEGLQRLVSSISRTRG